MADTEVRAYTTPEIRGEFLTNLYVTQSILDKQQKQKGIDIAYTVLSSIDEGTPLFAVVASDINDDIAGELHSMILSSDEILNQFEQTGKYPKSQKALVDEVRRLASVYDMRDINDSHALISAILKLFDFGIKGHTYELKAIGHEEDIEYYTEMGSNYYPLEGENIAGNLAHQYERIVDACKERDRKKEIDSMFLVPKPEITPPTYTK